MEEKCINSVLLLRGIQFIRFGRTNLERRNDKSPFKSTRKARWEIILEKPTIIKSSQEAPNEFRSASLVAEFEFLRGLVQMLCRYLEGKVVEVDRRQVLNYFE